MDKRRSKVSYTAAGGGEDIFKIEGLSNGTTLVKPVTQVSGYSKTLPAATNIKIIPLEISLDGSTINAGGITSLTTEFAATVKTSVSATVNGVSYISTGEGLTISTTATGANLTNGTITVTGEQVGVKVSNDSGGVAVEVKNGAVISITGLNDGGKTYTRTGNFISDDQNYYTATDTANILEMTAASGYIEIENDPINLIGATSEKIFGFNGKEVAKYIDGVLTISGDDTYTVKTSGEVTIGSETYTSSGALEISASASGSGLTSGTVSLNTSDGKNISVNNDSDGVTVTVKSCAVKSVGGSVTYDGKTYKHTINLPSGTIANK